MVSTSHRICFIQYTGIDIRIIEEEHIGHISVKKFDISFFSFFSGRMFPDHRSYVVLEHKDIVPEHPFGVCQEYRSA